MINETGKTPSSKSTAASQLSPERLAINLRRSGDQGNVSGRDVKDLTFRQPLSPLRNIVHRSVSPPLRERSNSNPTPSTIQNTKLIPVSPAFFGKRETHHPYDPSFPPINSEDKRATSPHPSERSKSPITTPRESNPLRLRIEDIRSDGNSPLNTPMPSADYRKGSLIEKKGSSSGSDLPRSLIVRKSSSPAAVRVLTQLSRDSLLRWARLVTPRGLLEAFENASFEKKIGLLESLSRDQFNVLIISYTKLFTTLRELTSSDSLAQKISLIHQAIKTPQARDRLLMILEKKDVLRGYKDIILGDPSYREEVLNRIVNAKSSKDIMGIIQRMEEDNKKLLFSEVLFPGIADKLMYAFTEQEIFNLIFFLQECMRKANPSEIMHSKEYIFLATEQSKKSSQSRIKTLCQQIEYSFNNASKTFYATEFLKLIKYKKKDDNFRIFYFQIALVHEWYTPTTCLIENIYLEFINGISDKTDDKLDKADLIGLLTFTELLLKNLPPSFFIEPLRKSLITIGELCLKNPSKKVHKGGDIVLAILKSKTQSNQSITLLSSASLDTSPPKKKMPVEYEKIRDSIKAGNKLDSSVYQSLVQDLKFMSTADFKAISISEFSNLKWQKAGYQHEAPGIYNYTQKYESLSAFCTQEILSCKDKREARRMMSFFIKIMNLCCSSRDVSQRTKTDKELSLEKQEPVDISSAMAIFSALNQGAISRLKDCWKHLTDKRKEEYVAIEKLFNSANSFKELRTKMATFNEKRIPYVPYLGIFLSDLTFIDGGNPSLVDGTIYEPKIILLADCTYNIYSCQQRLFNDKTIHTDIFRYLSAPKISSEELYIRSNAIESKDITDSGRSINLKDK